ncbi:MAG TPA: choice-of-anchor tandem repeat GloVer-containing protein [Rhizomicrobium sp.]|nr:choice-of-anchor tandem repeat GloVer-containing protein [Rhizomicrobium sp.]
MRRMVLCSIAALMAATAGSGASAKTKESILYSFEGTSDGRAPSYLLLRDDKGALYGTTVGGGAGQAGVVYKLSRAGELTVLHDFAGGMDGSSPSSNVVMDSKKTLYGATYHGGNGAIAGGDCDSGDCGTIYKIKKSGRASIIHAFTGMEDGGNPSGDIAMGTDGSLYGTTTHGGAGQHGVVFKVGRDGKFSVLHAFAGGPDDGERPVGDLILDDDGNIYGTAAAGGAESSGTVFKVAPGGTMTLLHSFGGDDTGFEPLGGLLRDGDGNLYGTTAFGGSGGFGAVFKLTPGGTASLVRAFTNDANGGTPGGHLTWGPAGNIYGIAASGGTVTGDCPNGCGLVYSLALNGKLKVLHRFGGAGDGRTPGYGMVPDDQGLLYGASGNGGASNAGAVYRIKPGG